MTRAKSSALSPSRTHLKRQWTVKVGNPEPFPISEDFRCFPGLISHGTPTYPQTLLNLIIVHSLNYGTARVSLISLMDQCPSGTTWDHLFLRNIIFPHFKPFSYINFFSKNQTARNNFSTHTHSLTNQSPTIKNENEFPQRYSKRSILKDTCNKYFPTEIQNIRIPCFIPRECPALLLCSTPSPCPPVETIIRTYISTATVPLFILLAIGAFLLGVFLFLPFLFPEEHSHAAITARRRTAVLEVKNALLTVEKEEREAEIEKFVEEIEKIDRDEELAEVPSLGQKLNMEAFLVLAFIFCSC